MAQRSIIWPKHKNLTHYHLRQDKASGVTWRVWCVSPVCGRRSTVHARKVVKS